LLLLLHTLVNRLDCRRKGAKGFYLGGQATVVKSPVIGCWRTDSSAHRRQRDDKREAGKNNNARADERHHKYGTSPYILRSRCSGRDAGTLLALFSV